jgi:exopolysaccharide biosynthesis polyprenyl glycosylphosphotransferase
MDGLALLLGVVVIGSLGRVGLAYAAVALTLLGLGLGCRGRIDPRLSDDVPRLIALLAVAVLPIAPFFVAADLGRLAFALPGIVALLVFARGIAYRLLRVARARGMIVDPTLVVGTGRLGHRMADTLCHHPEYGLVLVGFLGGPDSNSAGGTVPSDLEGTEQLPLPLLGPVSSLAHIVHEHRIHRVIIAFDRTSEQEMIPVLRDCDQLPVEIHVIPRFFELGVAPEGLTTDDMWGIPLVRLKRSALRTFAWRTKRTVDVALASVLVVLTFPVLVAGMVAVRITSPGPIFFRQTRVGQRGEIFELVKLRTLYVDDDEATWGTDSEARATPAGRFLRRTSIDELPQLINVLRGQMSLVGPRPERPFFADRFRVAVGGYGDRQRVPAGLTGWAQVHGLRGNTSINDRALFDNHYVENWSLWRDVVIIARTIGPVLLGKGS